MKNLIAVLALALLSACASLQPSVKAVCSVCTTVCPVVNGLRAVPVCVEGKRMVVVNWKAVEKGEEPRVECK